MIHCEVDNYAHQFIWSDERTTWQLTHQPRGSFMNAFSRGRRHRLKHHTERRLDFGCVISRENCGKSLAEGLTMHRRLLSASSASATPDQTDSYRLGTADGSDY
jgi:hypothetical protein